MLFQEAFKDKQINTGETMKTQLTKEQSQHLIELGFPKWKVQEIKPSDVSLKDWTPTITLTDLLDILPKEILIDGSYYKLIIEWSQTSALVCYRNINGMLTQHFVEKELIDALYELACWYYEREKQRSN